MIAPISVWIERKPTNKTMAPFFKRNDLDMSFVFYTVYLNSYEICTSHVSPHFDIRLVYAFSNRSHLSKFSFLTLFIKEVLRLYSPVFAIARRTTNPLTFPRGFGKDCQCLDDNPVGDEFCCILGVYRYVSRTKQ